jgi:hypothetical protein
MRICRASSLVRARDRCLIDTEALRGRRPCFVFGQEPGKIENDEYRVEWSEPRNSFS